jgi:hypothetical protein
LATGCAGRPRARRRQPTRRSRIHQAGHSRRVSATRHSDMAAGRRRPVSLPGCRTGSP